MYFNQRWIKIEKMNHNYKITAKIYNLAGIFSYIDFFHGGFWFSSQFFGGITKFF